MRKCTIHVNAHTLNIDLYVFEEVTIFFQCGDSGVAMKSILARQFFSMEGAKASAVGAKPC